MSQISTKDSGIVYLTKNSKTNNNIAGYHLVSRRVISPPLDVQCVYRCVCIYYYHVSVSNMLLQLLQCVIKKRKITSISGAKFGTGTPQSSGSRTLLYVLSIMLLIFTSDSENTKSNNNIVCYNLVSCRVISNPQMFGVCADPPKEPSCYPKNITLQFYKYCHKNYYTT